MRRKHIQLGSASCSQYGRFTRGGIGAAVGGVAGLLVGIVGMYAYDVLKSETAPSSKTAGFLLVTTPIILGLGVGATVGALKPQCG